MSNTPRQLDAVDFARNARCPYCTQMVSMSARALGDHRVNGEICDGSRRRVGEFDHHGFAIFETRRSDAAFQVGDCSVCRRKSLDTTRGNLDEHASDPFDLFMSKICSGSGRRADNLRWEFPGGYAAPNS